MTRATQVKYYSSRFFDLAEAISKDKTKVVEMEFPSRAEAKAFRLEFYSFRAAAEREELTKDYPELCAITILVDRSQPTKLKIMHRDNTPNAVALAKALKDAK